MGNGTPRHSLRRIPVALALLTVLILFIGCENDGIESPDDLVTSFITDLRRGDRDQALEAMWPPTRQEIEAAYDELEEALGEPPPVERNRMLLVTALESPMLISSTTIEGGVPAERAHGDEVIVTVEYRDGRSAEITTRWHDERHRWFVDVPVGERQRLKVWSILMDADEESVLDGIDEDIDDTTEMDDGDKKRDSVSGEATGDE